MFEPMILITKCLLDGQFSAIDRLSVKDSTLVHRILFDGKKAIGVEIEKNGNRENIYSNEVILSGGAINSPQLLMLSGIGNADHLKVILSQYDFLVSSICQKTNAKI